MSERKRGVDESILRRAHLDDRTINKSPSFFNFYCSIFVRSKNNRGDQNVGKVAIMKVIIELIRKRK